MARFAFCGVSPVPSPPEPSAAAPALGRAVEAGAGGGVLWVGVGVGLGVVATALGVVGTADGWGEPCPLAAAPDTFAEEVWPGAPATAELGLGGPTPDATW